MYNVKCEQTDGKVNGREYHGLVYFATDDNGNVIASPFKASRLGKFASRTAIDSRFEKAADKIDVRPTKRTVAEVMAQSSGKDDFIAGLKGKNIDLVLRHTEDGRIYGATYIDHNTKTVLNGSRLGKEFSANALDRWFDNPVEKLVIQPVPIESEDRQHQPTGGQHQSPGADNPRQEYQPAHHDSQNHQSKDYDDSSVFDGLGGLFSVGPAYDPQEDAFYREMQRRRKKKKRGPRL